MTVGLGVIGLGGIGKVHISHLVKLSGARVMAVCDTDQAKVDEVSSRYNVRGYCDYRYVLEDPAIDAVYILTPPCSHLTLVKEAVEAGKDVFCEKPLAPTLEEGEAILRVVKQSGSKFMIGFQERFSLPNLEARTLIEEGRVGRLVLVRVNGRVSLKTFGKGGGWLFNRAEGGGVILEASVHYIDLVRWLTGHEISRVSAEARLQSCGKALYEDNVAMILGLEDSSIALLDCSFTLPIGIPMDQRVEILGTDGVIYLDMFRHFLLIGSNCGVNIGGGQEFSSPGLVYPDVFRQSPHFGAYRRESEHFIECVRNGQTPCIGVDDAFRALRVALAAAEAAEAHRTVEL